MSTPKISVVMSVFNGGRYLAQALDSIFQQSFADFELIAIDDGSSDRSAEILRERRDPRLRVITNEVNIGLTRSLNRGLAAARGLYVARHDADDVSHPDRFARQAAFLDANPSFALVGARLRIIDEHGRLQSSREVSPSSELGVRWTLLFSSPFAHSSVMFRRTIVYGELGGYDESFQFNQDFELWSRLSERHGALNLREALLDYRAHRESIAGSHHERGRDSRLRNVARNIEVQRRNIRRILGREDLAEEWPPLWTSLNVEWLTGPPAAPETAVALLDAMYEAFCSRYPDAITNDDVRRGRATILAKIAYELARTNRRAACAAYRGVVTASPGVARRWAAPIGARVILGQRGARAARRVRTLWRRA
jgi:glycosyltransferase involved in cell wall biosynthesis